MHLRQLFLLLAALGVAGVSSAQVFVMTGNSYSQDFDALASTGTTATWQNDSTLDGWSLYNSTGSAITSYFVNDGSFATGAFYSYGATNASDRALGGVGGNSSYFGSPAEGSLAGYIVFGVTNGSGTNFSQVLLSYDGEQWRNGGNSSAQTMTMEYGFGSSYDGVASWVAAGNAFNFTSPVTGVSAGAVDGNSAGLSSGIGGALSVAWTAGDTLWIRWREVNDIGADHGLAIDNFSLSGTPASAVPEPSTYAAIFGGVALAGVMFWRRRAGGRVTA